MNQENNSALYALSGGKKLRWLLHVAFWLAVLVFYTIFFGYQNVNYQITFSFVIILLPVTIVTTYFLNYELLPNYLFKKRYFKFFLYLIYTLIVSFYIEMVTVFVIFIVVAGFNLSELHPSNTNALFLIAGMYVVVFLGVAVKLINQYNQNQVELQQLRTEKIEAELKFLKAQLHPHFLFNTLNNLYSLTLEKSDKASDVVLKLSELLDYVLYQCDADSVPLEKEIQQMHNYIELEKLRYGRRLEVKFKNHIVQPKQQLPPMLMMTLLENSFKHGVSRSMANAWIEMELENDDDWIVFSIKNSKANDSKASDRMAGGIGLENLRNRLELIFKKNYSFDVHELEDSYEVQLKFKLEKD